MKQRGESREREKRRHKKRIETPDGAEKRING